ncbi:hypothetical protein [Fredinandcohnia sp. 179-A 10B2 NHS]|uniref:hypothetical protein n=1 Tax=Fredinandcohnia sp. 179-A 10B2 NHS TaxID=3235176 RepID=UPI0039A14461
MSRCKICLQPLAYLEIPGICSTCSQKYELKITRLINRNQTITINELRDFYCVQKRIFDYEELKSILDKLILSQHIGENAGIYYLLPLGITLIQESNKATKPRIEPISKGIKIVYKIIGHDSNNSTYSTTFEMSMDNQIFNEIAAIYFAKQQLSLIWDIPTNNIFAEKIS